LTPQHTPMAWLDEQRKVVPAGHVTPRVAHEVHTDSPVVNAYEPAAHVWQVSDVLAPCRVEYVPAGQTLHVICPSMEVYWPVPQTGQTETPTPPPYVPARQAEHAEALASEKNPLEQA
jgi:hypothetical protein